MDAFGISLPATHLGRGFPPCMDEMGTHGSQPLAGAQNYSCVLVSAHSQCGVCCGFDLVCRPASSHQTPRYFSIEAARTAVDTVADRAAIAGFCRLRDPRGAGRE